MPTRYTYAGHPRDVLYAVSKALAKPEEDQLHELLRVLDRVLLGPMPPETVDGWARLAVREGARLAWSGRVCELPPDLPPGEVAMVFATVQAASFTYTIAAMQGARRG